MSRAGQDGPEQALRQRVQGNRAATLEFVTERSASCSTPGLRISDVAAIRLFICAALRLPADPVIVPFEDARPRTDHALAGPRRPLEPSATMTRRGRLFGRGRPGLLARSRLAPQSFAEFYAEMAPAVLRYFARETRNPHHAFDLTAETFAKAFEKRGDFRGATDAQAASWLWSIARHELSHFRRSRAVEFGALGRLALERREPADDQLRRVEELTALDEAREHVEQALRLLPDDQREVIRMRYVERLSYDEIAERLGISHDVARARVSRGLRALRANDHVHQAVQALEV